MCKKRWENEEYRERMLTKLEITRNKRLKNLNNDQVSNIIEFKQAI